MVWWRFGQAKMEEGGSRATGFYGFSYFVLCLERNLTYHLKEDGVAVFYWLA